MLEFGAKGILRDFLTDGTNTRYNKLFIFLPKICILIRK